ncbi:hypothetical protein F9H41_21525 [Salmonella enterica subsp. enterica serovar Montevideo]|uniref:Anthrax toxin edema factor central domain-containing protein n=4 Tax=Salmonella enterica TaxID=28901 RepID=A0A5I3ENB1_SALET|nr:hypothetical protein [Salmonella enterica subsp. enterica serovar Bredeney]EAA4402049.1 hypothetical protein [Salmonella enterica subsp. enterica serovar London]EAA7354191.1 hypothetical protein [Salmonella enterica subsp. enterica]EAB7892606.1 hypothetical protein [Salmonella enterica subsp. enterica serovar Newport]EAP2626201.1 hypothetical protein [Salmonella enterica]EBW5413710.1 hypothetical protein [Salmonella enterica subsp. enterica serovar Bonn]EBY7415661.1 hypothetical protein [S
MIMIGCIRNIHHRHDSYHLIQESGEVSRSGNRAIKMSNVMLHVVPGSEKQLTSSQIEERSVKQCTYEHQQIIGGSDINKVIESNNSTLMNIASVSSIDHRATCISGNPYGESYIADRVRKYNFKENRIFDKCKFTVGADFDPGSHLYSDAFQKCSNKYNVIIGLRYPSKIGQLHLKEGFPSKNFHVKAKSSVSGPTAGFIPEKALYSKKKWA